MNLTLQNRIQTALACVVMSLGLIGPAWAAEADFVGIVALAVEPEVAAELGLTAEVQKELKDLITKREDEVTALALKLSKLPAAERKEELKPFVAESEKLGLALLTVEQRCRTGREDRRHGGE
jgi:hypothetical protein